MDIFLVNQDNPHSRSLMLKLSDRAKPGAIIPLTTEEMTLYRSEDFQILTLNEDQSKIIPIIPEASYLFLLDPSKDSIDDALQAIDDLQIDARIIMVGCVVNGVSH